MDMLKGNKNLLYILVISLNFYSTECDKLTGKGIKGYSKEDVNNHLVNKTFDTMNYTVFMSTVQPERESDNSNDKNLLDKGYNVKPTISMTNFTPKEPFISSDFVKSLLLQHDAQAFLSRYQSEFQRTVIYDQLKYCPYTNMCGFSFNLSLATFLEPCCENCTCDFPVCMETMSCCPDIMFDHFNEQNISDLNEFMNQYRKPKYCTPLFLSKESGGVSAHAFAFSHCPPTENEDISNNCTKVYNAENISNLKETVPVINKLSGELYRNIYCAMCNGNPEDQLELLQLQLSCERIVHISTEKDVMKAIYTHGDCVATFQTDANIDYCTQGISSCSLTVGFEFAACSLYRSVVNMPNHLTYQNVFCGICNGFTPEWFECYGTEHAMVEAQIFSFSGILKLEMVSDDLIDDFQRKCLISQLYDPITETCKDLVCSDLSVLTHGECRPLYEKLKGITYTAYIRLTPIGNMLMYDAYDIVDDVIDYISAQTDGNSLCNLQILYRVNTSFIGNDSFSILDSNFQRFEVRVQYHDDSPHDPFKYVDDLLRLNNLEFILNSNSTNETFTLRFEVKDDNPEKFDAVDRMPYVSLNYTETESILMTLLFTYRYTPEDNDSVIVPHLDYNNNFGFCMFSKISFDILKLTRCPKVEVNISDVPWIVTSDGLDIGAGDGDVFAIDDVDYYMIGRGRITVCLNRYKEYLAHIKTYPHSNYISPEAIISVVCACLSISSLCITLFIFCLFPQLRKTIPGKNNMSLIIALICAQSLWIIGSFGNFERSSNECVAVGILLHFSMLVALFWMNICTFHLCRVLTRSQVMSHSSGAKKVMIYHLYAILLSTVFVSINIAISYTMYGDIGYGNISCYISVQRMIIFTLYIPAACIVLSNILMFIVVMISIKRSSEVQKNVQNSRNDLVVFAKLSTITGATWLFGFLYTWTDIKLMSYLFIVLTASQGVFIMFAFVINKRVLALFRKRRFLSDTSYTTANTTLHSSSKTQ